MKKLEFLMLFEISGHILGVFLKTPNASLVGTPGCHHQARHKADAHGDHGGACPEQAQGQAPK